MLKKLGVIVATSTVITQSFTQVQAQATSPDIWKEARDSYMEREHIVNNQITANNQVSMRRPGLKEQIRVLTEQLASVAERLGTVEADGAGNMDDVLERLGTVEADVGTNTSAIGKLGNDLDAVEAAIESVAPIKSLFEFLEETEVFPNASNRRVTGFLSKVKQGEQIELFANICVDFLLIGSGVAPEVHQVIGDANLKNFDEYGNLTIEVTAPFQARGDPTLEALDCVSIQWRGTCQPEVRRMLADEEVQATCTLTITLDNTDANDGYKIRGDNSYWGYKVFAAAETK